MENTKKSLLKKAIKDVKLNDIGEKPMAYGEPVRSSKEPKKYYPSLFVRSSDVPFLKNAKVGDKKLLVVKALLKSRSIWDDQKGSKEEYSLQIQEIGDAS